MNGPCEVVLTNTPADLPEALREAALAHLRSATQHPTEELRRLLREPQPVLARPRDLAEAQRLQATLRQAGWLSELRPLPIPAAEALAPPQPGVDAAQGAPAGGLGPAAVERTCPACRHRNAASARFCGQCGAALPATGVPPAPADEGPGALGAAARSMAGFVGLPPVRGFSVGDLLGEVFKRRSPSEVEDHLLAGTLRATPPLADVSPDWPRPWLFARLFASALLLYAIFHVGWLVFGNTNLLPGLMVIGSFIVPLSVVVLFYELNAPRNVSLFLITKLVLLGGAGSLLISLVLFRVGSDISSLIGASAAGLIEETGKLAAVLLATRSLSPVRYRYTLNGLVFGAAVGAGFAAFESAGYAFNTLLKQGSPDAMSGIILLRGVLSPAGHVVWTALAAGALWRVKGALSYHGTMLADGRFLRLFFTSVLCHVIWNAPFSIGHWTLKYLVLAFVAWAVALSLVQDGLMQVKREQRSAGAG
jgi:RsiW-degrading membrane proteinase PrsW (M82 family)